MKKIYIKCVTLLFALSAIVSCNFSSNSKNKLADNTVTFESYRVELSKYQPNIMNIDNIRAIVELSGIPYMPNLAAEPLNWEKHLNHELLLAASIGIYTVDGLYFAAFDDFEKGHSSFMAGKSIMEEIGVTGIYDKIIIERLEEGNTPKDELISKFSKTLQKSENVFSEKDSYRLFAALVTGAYVEKLYLLVNSIFSLPSDFTDEQKMMLTSKLILLLEKEIGQLPELIELLSKYKEENDSLILYNELIAFRVLQEEIGVIDFEKNITPESIFSNSKLKDLHLVINNMRLFLIEGV